MNSNSNELNKPDVPDSLNQDELKGMEFVANMRATADKHGWLYGWLQRSQDWKIFINTNLDEDDPVYQKTEEAKDSNPEQ